MGGIHFEGDGTVTIVTGTLDYGQGHWTPLAQLLTGRLGVPFERIRLVQGDSDRLIARRWHRWFEVDHGERIRGDRGERERRRKGPQVAAHVLEAGEGDIEFSAGRFTIAGTDRGIGIIDLAARLRAGADLPADVPSSLDVDHVHAASPSAFPNGCHVAEVEIDPETGVTEVVRYTMVNDFGTLVNPMLVEGQVHGGVMQGIGQALLNRRTTTTMANSSPAHTWTTPCRGPPTRRISGSEPRHPDEGQSGWRQGLRRGRLRRRAALGHERGDRRAFPARHPPHRHARDAAAGVDRASGCR